MTDPVATGEKPDPRIAALIVRLVAQRYPCGGNQLCAAIEAAIDLTWTARHELAVIEREQRDTAFPTDAPTDAPAGAPFQRQETTSHA